MAAGHTLSVTAGGPTDLNDCSDLPGAGWLDAKPHITLSYHKLAQADLTFTASGPCRPALLINDATNEWQFAANDDDDESGVAKLSFTNAANGFVDIWVASREATSCDAEIKVSAVGEIVAGDVAASSDTCPDAELSGETYRYTGESLAIPRRLSVIAGGPLSLVNCRGIAGFGHVSNAPDFTLKLEDGNGGTLRARTSGSCETVLVASTGSGQWRYAGRQEGSEHTELAIADLSDGTVNIWVGMKTAEKCPSKLTLSLGAPTTESSDRSTRSDTASPSRDATTSVATEPDPDADLGDHGNRL